MYLTYSLLIFHWILSNFSLSNSIKGNILAPIFAYLCKSSTRKNPQNNQIDEKWYLVQFFISLTIIGKEGRNAIHYLTFVQSFTRSINTSGHCWAPHVPEALPDMGHCLIIEAKHSGSSAFTCYVLCALRQRLLAQNGCFKEGLQMDMILRLNFEKQTEVGQMTGRGHSWQMEQHGPGVEVWGLHVIQCGG